jgi:hypothetical protein
MPPDPVFTKSDEALLAALEEQPLPPVCQFARATHPASGHTVRYLGWVRHPLPAADKLVRARLSLQLLEFLKPQRRKSWHGIITLDKSWFYFATESECILLPLDIPALKGND